MANSVRSSCPACQKTLKVDETWIGRRVRCPVCQHRYTLTSVTFGDVDTQVPDAVRSLSAGERVDSSTGVAAADRRSTGSRASQGASSSRRMAAEPSIGKLGRFELKSALGQGTFGRVYRAFDPLLGRMVALKVPRFGAEEKSKVRRFHTEARSAAGLRHPNIVAVFESGESDGQLFIATEYVEGRPLSAVIDEARPGFRKAAAWVRDLAEALDYAHEEGVVHRDIKPENIMFGVHERLQIMDFGLAKRIDEEASMMTADGSLMGTPAYMSPEQARGEVNTVGPPSDQYSLGVILYELLTGRRPFSGPVHSVISQVISTEPPAPRSLDPQIPPDLAAICSKAIEKDPARRYSSLGEMAADLDRWLSGEETVARPIRAFERVVRWCRRNPMISALSAAAMVMAIVALAGWLQATVAGKHAQDSLAAEAQSRSAAEAAGKRATDSLAAEATARQAAETAGRHAADSLVAEATARKAAETAGRRAADSLVAEAQARSTAEAAGRRAEAALAESYFERGFDQCQLGNFGHGMLWMTLGLKSLSATDRRMEPVIRANLTVWKNQMCTLERLWNHRTGIWATAYSRDGRLCATGSEDGVVQIWDMTTGTLAGEPLTEPSKIWSIVFSPQGDRLFVSHESRVNGGFPGKGVGLIRVWNLKTHTIVGKPMTHPGRVRCIAMSPDSKTLLSVCEDGLARLWNVENRRLISTLGSQGGSMAVAFSPDGALAAVSGQGAVFWRLSKIKPFGSEMRHRYRISCLEFTPDGKTLVTGGWDHTVRRWSVPDGREIGEPLNIEGACAAVAISADGRQLAMGGDRGNVQLAVLPSGTVRGQRLEQPGPVRALAWSPDGRRLVVGCEDGVARVWSVPSHNMERVGPNFAGKASTNYCLAVNADANHLLSGGGDGEVNLWDVQTRKHIRRFKQLAQASVTSLAFHPGGRRALSARADLRPFYPALKENRLEIWDIATGQPAIELPSELGQILCAFYSHGGAFAVTARDNGALAVLDAEALSPLWPPVAAGPGLCTASLSADDRVIAAGFRNGSVRLFDRLNGKPIEISPIQHGAPICSVIFSPDGKLLLTMGLGNVVRFWNAQTGQPDPRPALQHDGEVFRAAYSPDGRLIATVSNDKTARFWDAATGFAIGSPLYHKGAVYAMAFANDRELITGGDHPDDAGRGWPVPEPFAGSADQVLSKVELLGGLVLNDDKSTKPLTIQQWRDRAPQIRP